MSLAAIILFVYNRPEHSLATLQALSQNPLADESILYVFADGPKDNSDFAVKKNIDETRRIVKSRKWCKKVIIEESEMNQGLANTIINGITKIIDQEEKVIILEDDLVTSPGFLKYMNQSLILYEYNEKVGCIHAWNYDLDLKGQKDETFFLRGADCWGWATWKRAWDLFEPNGEYLLEKIKSKKLEYAFNRNGTHSYVKMLEDQINGKNDSWAIRWHASLFLNNMFCLQPVRPIVKNIGLDGSGVHSGSTPILQMPVDFINVNRIDIKESKWFFKAYKKMIREGARLSIWQFLKNWAKKYFPHS